MYRKLIMTLVACAMLIQPCAMARQAHVERQLSDYIRIDADLIIPDIENLRPATFLVKDYDVPIEALIAAMGMDGSGILEDDGRHERYTQGEASIHKSRNVSYSAVKNTELHNDLPSYIYRNNEDYRLDQLDTRLLKGKRQVDGMSPADIVPELDALMQSIGVYGWDVEYLFFPITVDDVEPVLARVCADLDEEYTFTRDDEYYYIKVICSHDGIELDDRSNVLLNDQYIYQTEMDVIWGKDGLIEWSLSGYRPIVSVVESDADMLDLDDAIDAFASYFDGILMNDLETVVRQIALVYSPYPISESEYALVPAWRFAVAYGFDGELVDRIFACYRVNAYTGEFLE
ncbi:MAG: hypothetical protein Q4D04_11590 [Clostridia bacterium]|nr:hypothetical protein [Clostridia bacterium]